jgi:hypothetical protein
MPDFNERLSALESIFQTVDIGDWGNGERVPMRLAMRINPARSELRSTLTAAVQLAAQAKLTHDTNQGEGLGRLTSEIIEDWCGTRVPGVFPPRPHWTSIVEQLGVMAEGYPLKSTLREAAFELGRRVLDRAQEIGRQQNK